MAKYIDKSALVAEIKKMLDKHSKLQLFNYGAVKDLESLLNFLDTLEVKEVDLEKEIDIYINFCPGSRDYIPIIARHFFDLGLKTQEGEEI